MKGDRIQKLQNRARKVASDYPDQWVVAYCRQGSSPYRVWVGPDEAAARSMFVSLLTDAVLVKHGTPLEVKLGEKLL